MAVSLLCATALALAGPAYAGPAREPLAAILYTEAGNGFTFYAEAHREARGKASVAVTLYGDRQTVVYEKHRGVRLTRNQLRFRLGSLGSVDMDFEGRRFRHRRDCEGVVVRKGLFRGRLHFRGEDSYTVAHAGKARAYVQAGSGSDSGCGLFGHRDDRKQVEEATLTSCGPGPKLSFVAQAEPWAGFLIFAATLQEQAEGLDIYRSAVLFDDGGEFTFDEESYRRAKVRPAWPYTGTAVYEDGELSGNLSVLLPGVGSVPLAPSSRANLRERAVPGRSCGIDSGPPLGFYYSAPGSAPEDPAAVGFYRR